MNYFGLFFSFMIPSIILGFMIAAACIQERAIHRRRAQHKQAAPHKEANVRCYSPSAKPQHNNAVKSDKSKLYIRYERGIMPPRLALLSSARNRIPSR